MIFVSMFLMFYCFPAHDKQPYPLKEHFWTSSKSHPDTHILSLRPGRASLWAYTFSFRELKPQCCFSLISNFKPDSDVYSAVLPWPVRWERGICWKVLFVKASFPSKGISFCDCQAQCKLFCFLGFFLPAFYLACHQRCESDTQQLPMPGQVWAEQERTNSNCVTIQGLV